MNFSQNYLNQCVFNEFYAIKKSNKIQGKILKICNVNFYKSNTSNFVKNFG